MQVARVAIAVFLFFLAGIALFAGASILSGESPELNATGERVVGALWLLSALAFAAGGILVLRRPMVARTLLVLLAVLVGGGVMITLNPYFGAPLTATAVVIAVLGFAR